MEQQKQYLLLCDGAFCDDRWGLVGTDCGIRQSNYNLIVTVLDAKPNYLKSTIFGGEIVYNKNEEDPANFILRLKSLENALPDDDLTKSSSAKITQPDSSVKGHSLTVSLHS